MVIYPVTDGDYGAVELIELIATEQPMYNLTVEEAHTFFVGDGDWLVHNSNKMGCPDPLEIGDWENREPASNLSPDPDWPGIYEFKRGQGVKVGSSFKGLWGRLDQQVKEFKNWEDVVVTRLNMDEIIKKYGRGRAEQIIGIAERIRKEQLIENEFLAYGDRSAGSRQVRNFWNGEERFLIPNWPDWLRPPDRMLK